MSRREAKTLVREFCNNLLRDSITHSFDFLPLPNPPLEIPDFPANPPSEPSKIVQQALGISSIDTAGFFYRLDQVIERNEPSFIQRHIDSQKQRENWLLKNIETIGEQILILQIKDWFYAALDENSPDTDRWYLAVSALIGLVLRGSEITESQCIHLFNSIVVARQPGEWPQKKITGPHHISWDGSMETFTEEIAHPSGVLAANSILDIIELHESNHSTVLPYWLERLSINAHISNVLNLPIRIQNLIVDTKEETAENVVKSAVQLFSHHPEETKEILFEICNSANPSLRRNLATNLSRIHSENPEFAKKLLHILLNDTDSDTRVLSTTYLGTLARLEKYTFIEISKVIFQKEDIRMTQRLIESGIRHYLSIDSEDSAALIPIAWIFSNPESKSKLSGMLLELAKINPQSFQKISSRIFQMNPQSHKDLFDRINFRDSDIASLIMNNQ